MHKFSNIDLTLSKIVSSNVIVSFEDQFGNLITAGIKSFNYCLDKIYLSIFDSENETINQNIFLKTIQDFKYCDISDQILINICNNCKFVLTLN